MRVGTLFLGIVLSFASFSGCSSSGSGEGGGSCPQISGSWTLSGCSDTGCNVSQSGCSITLTCSPSGDTFTGSLSGNNVSFSTSSVSCSGTVNGATGSGTCSGGGQSCNFTATCQSGACGSGGGGTGGGGNIDCNQSCNVLTGCCTGMSMSDCLTGCTQNPNQTPACFACFNDTSCSSLTPCVVANCGVPSELCGAPAP